MNREWARDTDLDVLLPDDGFKKHIQHQCNKRVAARFCGVLSSVGVELFYWRLLGSFEVVTGQV